MHPEYKESTEYWNNFYKNECLGVEEIPSQFAAFVLGEFPEAKTIIDVGCGSGRDSFFFSRHISNVIGIDASSSSFKYCTEKNKTKNLNFIQINLSIWSECNKFTQSLSLNNDPYIVYARFLLHAIDEESEFNFLQMAKSIIMENGAIAVEFRTNRDEKQKKETTSHYRRYINPLEFIERTRNVGLKLRYFSEGFGFAKYKNDDAHVARFLFNINTRKKK